MQKMLMIAVLVAFTPLTAHTQVVVETPTGPLELIGLNRWTFRDLEDSLKRVAPGATLRSHACEAILQEKLGFPSASARTYVREVDGKESAPPTFVITLVEPHDSARVQWRPAPKDALSLPKRWRALAATVTDSSQKLNFSDLANLLQFYGTVRRDGLDAARARVARFSAQAVDKGVALWQALAALSSKQDLVIALRTLERDGQAEHRMLAAGVLTNFRDDARAWRALVATLRDPDERARGAASSALSALLAQGPVPVDWSPAVGDLRALLAGTNVSAFTHVLDVLARTQVRPSLATPLLRGNGDLLLAHARAQYAGARAPAWTLLGRLSSRANAGPEAWEQWLRELDAQGSAK